MTTISAAKNIAVSAVMAALLVAGKFVLSFAYNVEIITPLIIIFTAVFGLKRVMPAVLVFCVVDNMLYSFFYLVTIQYFFHWPLLCFLAHITNKFFPQKNWVFACLALLSALLFWIETPVINEIFNFTKFLPTLYAGILFMLPMAAGGFIFTFFGFPPLNDALQKIKTRIF